MTQGLMTGKRGVIFGIANDKSIAWGIAKALHAQGAHLAFTCQNEAFERRVSPLAESIGAHFCGHCDVARDEDIEAVFANLAEVWGQIDFVVHAVAFSDKAELKDRYLNTSHDNFVNTMVISCYSLTAMARYALPLLKKSGGGSILTVTYLGSERVIPFYNVMGVAKAALESSMRYLAADMGEDNIRVNALSCGPMRTLAGSAIGAARKIYNITAQNAPLQRNITLEEAGNSALFLLSDLSSAVTGEVVFADAGYHAVGLPNCQVSNS